MMKELEKINETMKREDEQLILILEHAPCQRLVGDAIPNFSNVQIEYVAKRMTFKIQEIYKITLT